MEWKRALSNRCMPNPMIQGSPVGSTASDFGPAPSRWFLPGPERMRGGAARRFASDRHFHRGIQAEATRRVIFGKATRYQRLAESRSWRAGFFCGIHLSQFSEATSWKPPLPEATLTSTLTSPPLPFCNINAWGEARQLRPAAPPQRQGLRPYRSTPVRPPRGRNPSDSVS